MGNQERSASGLLPSSKPSDPGQGESSGVSSARGLQDLSDSQFREDCLRQGDFSVDEGCEGVAQKSLHRIEGAEAKGYVSTEEIEYLDPKKALPPKGAQVMLLTIGGIGIKGVWRDDGSYVGWYPLPKIPTWARDQIASRFFNGKRS